MTTTLIESDTWRLWIEPETGVQWMAAEVLNKGTWHAVVPECRVDITTHSTAAGQAAHAPLAAANFHMLPYSNRIRDGQFAFAGQTIQLKNAHNHAIHGALRKLPWQIVSHTTHSLTCEISTSAHPHINWPWPIDARIDQQVDGNVLHSQLTLTNKGQTDMPAGCGWHPYFNRVVNGSEATLTLPVKAVYPDANGDCLPDGAAIPLPESLDFTTPRKLDADQRIDCCLAGLHGECDIHWQDGGIRLIMSASDNCTHLVLFNPDMPHFAVEPVTNANDAFNLASQGIDAGMVILPPGQSLVANMTLKAMLS